jgi:hypothetical protein
VHAVSGFLLGERCNILDSAQFSDRSVGTFFMRVAFEAHHNASLTGIRSAFETIAGRTKARVLIMVSRFGHCLNDRCFGTPPATSDRNSGHRFEQSRLRRRAGRLRGYQRLHPAVLLGGMASGKAAYLNSAAG